MRWAEERVLFLHLWGNRDSTEWLFQGTCKKEVERERKREDKVTRKTGGERAWCRASSPPKGEDRFLSEVGVPALRARESALWNLRLWAHGHYL